MTENEQPDFPAELLVALGGTIAGANGDYVILIELQTFVYDGETVEWTLPIDDAPLKAQNIEELVGQSFTFPPNPEDGYLETAIYIWHVHNPIDVLGITFGDIENGSIEATFEMNFVFEYEGCCNNLQKTLTTSLRVIEAE